MPFREVISCLHLFEESCSIVFDDLPWENGPNERISMLLTFDKLSHCRMMVLAETYFGTTQAGTQTRTQALEQEVARLAPDVQIRHHFHIVGESRTGKKFVALAPTTGNKLQAAKLLGISRKKLYAKIAKYQLAGE